MGKLVLHPEGIALRSLRRLQDEPGLAGLRPSLLALLALEQLLIDSGFKVVPHHVEVWWKDTRKPDSP